MNEISKSTAETLAAITTRNARKSTANVSRPVTLNRTEETTRLSHQTPIVEPPRRRSRKTKAVKNFSEPNITRRVSSDGAVSYMVQIRRRVEGKQHSLSKTFRHLPNAKKWRNKKLLEIEVSGFPIQIIAETTISDVIKDRLERGKSLGRSAVQNLNFICEHEFGQTKVAALTQQQLDDFADVMLAGDRLPQTVAGYMTHLARSLNWAKDRGALIPIEVVTAAMKTLWEDEILARSEERDRRPQLWEIDQILTAIVNNPRQKLPVAAILVFAIYSARRLGEICRLRWNDLNVEDSKILVREMKHPRKKKTNNVWCSLPPEALQIIQSMPRSSEFIFPYNPRSVGAAYRRHRDKVNVVDLRFHDLRHEAISRLSEMGMQAEFVAKVSGHKGATCLERYTHVEKVGDKYVEWPWLQRIIDTNTSFR